MERLIASILAVILFLPLCGNFWAPIADAFISHESHHHQSHDNKEPEIFVENNHDHYDTTMLDCCETEHSPEKIGTIQGRFSVEDVHVHGSYATIAKEYQEPITVYTSSLAYSSTAPPLGSMYTNLVGIVKKLS